MPTTLQAENSAPIPVDLVTTSASGLDPDITPAAAAFQVPSVAKARNLPAEKIQQLVDDMTEGRSFGLIGEKHVNVLKLNLALDALAVRARVSLRVLRHAGSAGKLRTRWELQFHPLIPLILSLPLAGTTFRLAAGEAKLRREPAQRPCRRIRRRTDPAERP